MPPKGYATPQARGTRDQHPALQAAMDQDEGVLALRRWFMGRWLRQHPGMSRLAGDAAWKMFWRQWFIQRCRDQGITLPPDWRAPRHQNYYYRQMRNTLDDD